MRLKRGRHQISRQRLDASAGFDVVFCLPRARSRSLFAVMFTLWRQGAGRMGACWPPRVLLSVESV